MTPVVQTDPFSPESKSVVWATRLRRSGSDLTDLMRVQDGLTRGDFLKKLIREEAVRRGLLEDRSKA
jgi:hypothetical protein